MRTTCRYKTPDEMQKVIDAYFKDCEGTMLRDEKTGEIMRDKFGHPIVIGQKPPTVTGLALALGFTSRQALLNYQAKPEFEDVITLAKARIEDYASQQLFTKDGARGAMFYLSHAFKGWRDADADSADVMKKLDEVLDGVVKACEDEPEGGGSE